jgi:hypothetical protein
VNVLFVTPNPSGSGEAITALHIGAELSSAGHEVQFLADPFTSRFLAGSFEGQVEELSDDPGQTSATWHRVLDTFRPRVIVFADHWLLCLSRRARVLLDDHNWKALRVRPVELVTLDHLGMAQGTHTLSFGPPHLDLYRGDFSGAPPEMKVLLPCPFQWPAPPASIRGVPFRSWKVPPALTAECRERIRGQYVRAEGERLVFHSVSPWAIEFCTRHQLPSYRYATRLFETYLDESVRPLVFVSVNGGSLLTPAEGAGFRVVNLRQLDPAEYDAILMASDLMITDNRISSSLAKAVCGLVPSVALRNSYTLAAIVERAGDAVRSLVLDMERERMGSVFPFEVFPIWSREDMDAFGLFVDNPILECFATLEAYGGEETRNALGALLRDPASRQRLRTRQQRYVDRVGRLPTGGEALLSSISYRT